MDADGLPIVGPGIDLKKVGAIHQKRTVAFLNHFITHTVKFLNHFSCVCEEKLSDLAVKIQRLETAMSILESKLSSIPGLENVTVTSNSGSGASAAAPASQDQTQSAAAEPTKPIQVATPDAAAEPEPDIVEEVKPRNTVSQDPRYAKCFKMVQMGVHPQAVKQKMMAEGLNPDYLDTPDAELPPESQNQQKDEPDSESDFSDDDDQQEQSSDSSVAFSDD